MIQTYATIYEPFDLLTFHQHMLTMDGVKLLPMNSFHGNVTYHLVVAKDFGVINKSTSLFAGILKTRAIWVIVMAGE